MDSIFSSLSDNATGIFLGVLAFLLGVATELVASAISEAYASGHIAIANKRTGWVVRVILWLKGKSQVILEKWFSNKNKAVIGKFFFYRLEIMEHQRFIWTYAELDLELNLANAVKGKYVSPMGNINLHSTVEGNFVLNKMLILFSFGQNNPKHEGPREIISIPDFSGDTANIGWVINTDSAENEPMPVIIKREMLNFPHQLKKEPLLRGILEKWDIHWDNFKNESE